MMDRLPASQKSFWKHAALALCFLFTMSLPAGPAYAVTAAAPSANATKAMTLVEAIHLALRYNRSIESSYLDRVGQKFGLEIAESKYHPNVGLDGSAQYINSDTSTNTRTNRDSQVTEEFSHGGGLTVTQDIPTGARLTLSWNTKISTTAQKDKDGGDTDSTHDNVHTDSWSVGLVQPLLNGAGIDYNMASIRLAGIQEKQNINNLKQTLIQTVTSVITSFRALVQAQKQAKINKASLERSKELMRRNKLQYKAGRMAEMDIVENQVDVANAQLEYQSGVNQLVKTKASLLQILDLPEGTDVVAVAHDETAPEPPSLEKCMELAKANSPTYLNALVAEQQSEISLMMAENARRWNLDLKGNYSETDTRHRRLSDTKGKNWSAGLDLSAPLFGPDYLSGKVAYIKAKIGLRKAKNQIKDTVHSLRVQIASALRSIHNQKLRYELSVQARGLSELQFKNEKRKLQAGKSTNFQVITYQSQLVTAEANVLSSRIQYLNQLTSLDQLLATTLATWEIRFNDQRKEYEKELDDADWPW